MCARPPLPRGGGAPPILYSGVIRSTITPPLPTAACPKPGLPADISTVTAAMLGPTAQYWVDMLPALRPGATQYQDLFTGVIPSTTNTTDGLLQSVFDLYYNPALSVIVDEIVGIADIDAYGGLGDNAGSGSYYFNGPLGLNGGAGKFLNDQAFST